MLAFNPKIHTHQVFIPSSDYDSVLIMTEDPFSSENNIGLERVNTRLTAAFFQQYKLETHDAHIYY